MYKSTNTINEQLSALKANPPAETVSYSEHQLYDYEIESLKNDLVAYQQAEQTLNDRIQTRLVFLKKLK